MSEGAPSVVLATWIMDRFTAAPSLVGAFPGGIHRGYTSRTGRYPAAFFFLSGAADIRPMGGWWSHLDALVTLQVVDQGGDNLPAAALAAQLHARLQNQAGATVDGRVLRCDRQTVIDRPDVDDAGVEWQYMGGVYRVLAQ